MEKTQRKFQAVKICVENIWTAELLSEFKWKYKSKEPINDVILDKIRQLED
jgi:hypothetical protein